MAEGTEPGAQPGRGGVEDTRDPAFVVLKFAGLFALVCLLCLGVAGAVLTFGPPKPAEVCAHKLKLATADTEGQDPETVALMLDNLRMGCVKEKQRRLQLRGKIAYWRYASCVLAADNYDASERC